MISVAGLTSGVAQGAVRAHRNVCRFVAMAGGAFNCCDFGRVRIVLDGGMTILAGERAVHAGRMFCRIDRNVFSGIRLHPRLAVACEAVFILLEGLRRFRLWTGVNERRCADNDQGE